MNYSLRHKNATDPQLHGQTVKISYREVLFTTRPPEGAFGEGGGGAVLLCQNFDLLILKR